MMHDTEATKHAAEHGRDNHDLDEQVCGKAFEFEHDKTNNDGDKEKDRMDTEERQPSPH